MGVMSCHRTGCEEIMCHTYITDIGYICGECQKEFKMYLETLDEGNEDLPRQQIKRRLEVFMETEKGIYRNDDIVSVDEFFKEYGDD